MSVGFMPWLSCCGPQPPPPPGWPAASSSLFALRLLLGMGESVAYPSYSKIFAMHFPEHHRGLANALIDAGSKFGPALGTLMGGLLMARFGWRPFFFVLGAASLVWLIPWLKWMPRGKGIVVARNWQNPPARHADSASSAPPGARSADCFAATTSGISC